MTDPWYGAFDRDTFDRSHQAAQHAIDQHRADLVLGGPTDPLTLEWLSLVSFMMFDLGRWDTFTDGHHHPELRATVFGWVDEINSWFDGVLAVIGNNDRTREHIDRGLHRVTDTASTLARNGFDPSESEGFYQQLAGKGYGLREAMAAWDPIRASAEEAHAREAAREAAARRARDEELEARERALEAQEALKSAYTELADSEAHTANLFRQAVMATLLATGAVSLTLAALQAAADTGTSEVLIHLAFSIPAFVLAGYFARESAQHRKMARWAAVLAVQLSTIRNYIRPLDPTQQNDLQAYFGRRVLGDLPGDFGGKDEDLTTALSALEKIAGELAARRP